MPSAPAATFPVADPALELVLTRDIALPRERLFRAWSGRLADWWAPRPLTTPVCEVDLRTGGSLRTVMRWILSASRLAVTQPVEPRNPSATLVAMLEQYWPVQVGSSSITNAA